MKHFVTLLSSFTLALSLAPSLPAQDQVKDFDPFKETSPATAPLAKPSAPAPQSTDTQITLLNTVTAITPGEPFTVALKLVHPAHWHSYYLHDGVGFQAPHTWTWDLPEGLTASELKFPAPHKYYSKDNELNSYTYEGTTYLQAVLTPSADLKVGSTVNLKASADWQICSATGCIPEEYMIDLNLPVVAASQPNVAAVTELDTFNKAHLPTSPPAEWAISAKEANDLITLKIKTSSPLPAKLSFFEYNKQVDAQKEHVVKAEDGHWIIQLPRNHGNKFSEQSGPVLATLKGILIGEGLAPVWVDTALAGSNPTSDSSTSSKTTAHTLAPTQEELNAGAALYNTDPVDFVTLDGTAEKELTFLTALIPAFLGGLILNLMPCVFPVLGIKVMGFVQQAGEDESKVKNHGLMFGLGVLVSMLLLSGAVIALINIWGQDINWGVQLTQPLFLAGIIGLLFVLGLNMAGIFEMGTSLTSAGGQLNQKKGYSGSFFSGALTTMIATPCSGPFLGTLMGFTLSQKPLPALVIFAVFAAGIASPYVVLAFFPKLIKKLPRPGAWMETFKVAMSFAMFATAAFFFTSFISQTGAQGGGSFLMALVIISLAAWLYGRFSQPIIKPTKKRIWGYAVPLLLVLASLSVIKGAASQESNAAPAQASHGDLQWEPWYPGKIEVTRPKKQIVWVDYTATW